MRGTKIHVIFDVRKPMRGTIIHVIFQVRKPITNTMRPYEGYHNTVACSYTFMWILYDCHGLILAISGYCKYRSSSIQFIHSKCILAASAWYYGVGEGFAKIVIWVTWLVLIEMFGVTRLVMIEMFGVTSLVLIEMSGVPLYTMWNEGFHHI